MNIKTNDKAILIFAIYIFVMITIGILNLLSLISQYFYNYIGYVNLTYFIILFVVLIILSVSWALTLFAILGMIFGKW
jgi:hypothetical protein